MDINAQEIAEWKQNPTTEKVFKYLLDRRLSLMEDLASGRLSEATIDGTAMKTANAVGECLTLKEITEISYKDISDFYQLEIEEEINNE